jgi:hypothetical protein
MDETITFTLFDEDILLEKPVGAIKMPISELQLHGGKNWINLFELDDKTEPSAKL